MAVLNTSEDVVQMLIMALEDALGVRAVGGHVIDLKSGKPDFAEFVKRYNPKVIIFDITPPYGENWEFLQMLLQDDAAKNREFVLTTANERLLKEIAGPDIDAFEISEKPYDIHVIVEAVRRKLNSLA